MKTLRNTLIFVAIIVLLALWLNSLPNKPDAPGPEEASSGSAPAPAAAPSAPKPPASQAAAPAPPPAAAKPMRTAANALPDIQAAAGPAGVKIIRFDDQGGSAILEVEWVSDQATTGSEFLEELRRRGKIGRFEPVGQPLRARMSQEGRRVYGTTYKVLF